MSFKAVLGQQDTLAAAIFMLFGSAFAIGALNYSLGTPMRMGPGYFPLVLGLALVAIGGLVLVNAVRTTDDEESQASLGWDSLRPLLLISTSIYLFFLTIHTLGLAAATFLNVVLSSFADRQFCWRNALASGALLALFVVAVFVYGLRLPFRPWPV